MGLHALGTTPTVVPSGIDTNDIATSDFAMNLTSTDWAPQFHTDGSLPLRNNILDLHTTAHSENSGWFNSASLGPSLSRPWTSSTINRTDVGSSVRICVAPGSQVTKSLAMRMWEYAHDLGPRIIWPPEGCSNCDELDPEGVAPIFRQSMMALTRRAPVESGFQDVCYFYSTYLTRLFYNYASAPDTLMKWIFRRFNASKSSKYGMLTMATLYRSDYQRSMMSSSWRAEAKDMHSLANLQLSRDMEDTRLTAWEKLTGLLVVMDYEYHTGQLSKYYSHGTQAAPLIKTIVGGDTIDLFKLRGEQMFDVTIWVWCDILDSMATSKPTRLKYESDLERTAQPTSEEYSVTQDVGLEWIYGIPNAFAVILARTSALRDAKLPEEEKASKAAELEQLIRNWQLKLLGTKDSRLRVARMGAQEIWRHTGILYIHHAIFKSDSSHPTVRESVKNIVKIACTLEPGGNPDSFLYISYFIAGFYAVSQNDRYTMKSRLIGCGNALYLRNLARNLEELWQETDSAGRLTSWSERKPPRIAF